MKKLYIATYGTNDTVPSTDGLKDTVVYPPHTVCTGTQTELTAMDIAALEADYQQRVKECSQVRVRLAFLVTWSDRESLQKTMPFCFRPNYG